MKATRACSIEECDRGGRIVRGWCIKHYERWRKYGAPTVVLGIGPGSLNNSWKGDDVPYHGAHSRVRRLHGSPRNHPCGHCGGVAQDWAYDHTDPSEKRDEKGRPYSVDPSHYFPLCRVCHRRFDRGGEFDETSQ